MTVNEKLDEIKQLIRNPMFAERDHINDALRFAVELADSSGSMGPAVLTAVFVVTNTIAKELDRLELYEREGTGDRNATGEK